MGNWRNLFHRYDLQNVAAYQVESQLNNIPHVIRGHIAVTLFTVFLCWGGSASFYVAVWGIVMMLAVIPNVIGITLLRREMQDTGRTDRVALKIMAMAGFRAALWFVGFVVLFPLISTSAANIMEFVVAGMVIGGVFSYLALPQAALVFSSLVASGGLAGMWVGHAPNRLALTGVMIVIFAFFNRLALAHAENMRKQHETAQHLRREQDVVGLLLRDFEDGSKDWLWQTDDAGYLIRGVSGFANVLHCNTSELTAQPLVAAFERLATSPEQVLTLRALENAFAHGHAFSDLELALGEGDAAIHLSLTAKPQAPVAGRQSIWHGVASNISDQRRAQAHVRRLALFDPLTNLPNRTQLRSLLTNITEAADGGPLWVAYGDLDGFKAVNDTQGHAAGDVVLKSLAQRFSALLQDGEVVARIGGDEFVFMLRRDAEAAEACWCDLINTAHEPVALGEIHVSVGLSLGIVDAAGKGLCVDETLRRADLALYNAKQQGRGLARFYTEEMDKVVQARSKMEAALRQAMLKSEFTIHYQPIYACDTGRVTSYEALLRWHHPQYGAVSPATFIPLAEENGLIADIGAWVLTKACQDAKTFADGVGVSVNISALQMKSRRLLADVTRALAQSGLLPGKLELEMTESALVENTAMAEALITDLKALGVGIALDDFGTGYSSLAYLHRFKFDRIKIDRSFVQAYGERHESRAVVNAVIMIGRELGIGITAEGIETEQQYRSMVERGCDMAQGFLLGRPAPLEAQRELDSAIAQ